MTKEDLMKALNEHKRNATATVLDFMKYEWSNEIHDKFLDIDTYDIKKAEKKMLREYKKRFKSWEWVWWPDVEKEFRKYIIDLNR